MAVKEIPTAPAVEKSPEVEELCQLNQQYLDIEKEYQKAHELLRVEFEKKQAPILQQRTQKLQEKKIEKFWLTAMKSVPALSEEIMEWDYPVLEHLINVTSEDLPDESGLNEKGFKLTFEFEENEFFSNRKLVRTFHTVRESEYVSEIVVDYIKMNEEIQWKKEKDITVELVQGKKKKGGGAKKKQSGPKLEPRPSFFRTFFRTIHIEEQDADELQDLIKFACDDEYEESDEPLEILEMIKDDALTQGTVIKDTLIPYAVVWYTGEALPEGALDDDDDEDMEGSEDDDEDDEDDDDEDDSDDDDDDDDDDDSPKGKKNKNLFKADGNKEKEECKQQ